MGTIKYLTIVILIVFLNACNHMAVKKDTPAYIVNPTKESRLELEQLISKKLNGIPVTLADNALTKDNRLILERKRFKDPQGNPIELPKEEMSYKFRLIKNAGKCILIYEADGSRMELKQTICEALN